jgi:hypothetical protein
MNKIIRHLICACACIACACNEEEVPGYAGESALYFQRGTGLVPQRDSTFYSFLSKELTSDRDTIYINICAMGDVQDRPRPFVIRQTATGNSDARPGIHYVPFDDPGMAPFMQMPARATDTRMPVILIRDSSLQQETVTLKMTIIENEEFKVVPEGQSTFKITFSDQLLPAANWKPGSALGWTFVFGDYGQRKHWFLITYVGFRNFDDEVSEYSLDVRRFYSSQAREKLAEYNANNPILTESDGTVVTFPTI